MKKILYLSLYVFCLFTFIACDKDEDDECINVEYAQDFEVSANNTYCFPDGNSLTINKLQNDFCPCDTECIWEGEMLIEMELTVDGETFDYQFHSSDVLESEPLPNQLKMESSDITFESECDANNPSPAIESAVLKVSYE